MAGERAETDIPAAPSVRLSIVVEWANTRLNGGSRAAALLARLDRQWREIVADDYPGTLPPEARSLLQGLDRQVELLIVSADALSPTLEDQVRRRLSGFFDVRIHVAPGLDYYPLKNFGASRTTGDLLLFVDSDVLPDDGWLAHLLGTFARPDVAVVCGQTHVAPTDLVARAFALGWTYPLPDRSGTIVQPKKFYANSLAIRTEVFRQIGGFPAIGSRSRGAVSLLGQALRRRGIAVWQNQNACVDHPPPSGFRHMVVRALAHGRDHYMKRSEERHGWGLVRSVGIAAGRLGRGCYRTFREWRQVGLRPWDVPPALAIVVAYYVVFAVGGLLTHVHPRAMSRRFRV